ncbi:MAG TPA: hypothetical protein VGY77_00715 [Gemmataceae bacterium]|jgi:hypothetical protein|nr:hypothetical protein [Gemmataceae bacterium]
MNLTVPFWFKQRQGIAEPAGTDVVKLTAPNLKPAFITIQKGENGLWSAGVRLEEGGPLIAATELEFPRPQEAWDAAFELYREAVVV